MPRRHACRRRSGAPSRRALISSQLEWPYGRRFVREKSPVDAAKRVGTLSLAAVPDVLYFHLSFPSGPFRALRELAHTTELLKQMIQDRRPSQTPKMTIGTALRAQPQQGTR